MGDTRKVKAGLVKYPSDQFIGEAGHLFFDIDTGKMFLSDGVTTGGIPLLDSLVTRDYINGLQVDAATVDGYTSEELLAASIRENQLLVSSIDDLPAPDANGVITLPPDIMVEPDGTVDLGTNVLELSSNTSIIGRDPGKDLFITNAPGKAVITGNDTGQVILRTFAVINNGGSAFDITTTQDVHVNLFFVGILGSTAAGTFTGGRVISFKNCYQGDLVIPGVGTFYPSAGPVFAGNITKVFYADSPIEGLQAGVEGIRLDASLVTDVVDIRGNYFKGTGGTALVVDPGVTVSEAVFAYNAISSGITPAAGVSPATPGWRFSANSGIADSRVAGGMRGDDNALTTTITTVGEPVKAVIPTVVPGGTGITNERIEMTADNRLTYTGERPTLLDLVTTFYLTSAANNQEITVYFALNGQAIPSGATTVLVGTGGDQRNGTIIGLGNATPGDYVEMWVSNDTSTADVTMLGLSMNLTGL